MLVFFLAHLCVAYAQSFRIPVILLKPVVPCQRSMYTSTLHSSCFILRVEHHHKYYDKTLLEVVGVTHGPFKYSLDPVPVMPRISLH